MVSKPVGGQCGSQAHLHLQVTAYYAPQFEAVRELVVEGGQPVFTACLNRCKKWLSRGGKSAVYFAKTRDERYVVKQLTRSEKQSFLDFAPAYFRSDAHDLLALLPDFSCNIIGCRILLCSYLSQM